MKTYLINENVVQALLVYLKKKPYEEVAEGVYALQTLPEYVVPEVAQQP